jgi:transposase InsO family protein
MDGGLYRPLTALRCRQNGIEHRLTKPSHRWTNGQVERMNVSPYVRFCECGGSPYSVHPRVARVV